MAPSKGRGGRRRPARPHAHYARHGPQPGLSRLHRAPPPDDAERLHHVGPPVPHPTAHRDPADLCRGQLGAEWHPDFHPREDELVMRQHWSSSGFANTDLDFMLKQHHIRKILLIGMRANTCVDTTARFGQELGYHVTLIRDAIASFSWEEMTATFELNAPLYAHAILTTDEFVDIVNDGAGKGSP
ncbi:hypothetical protein CGL27_47930 [Streptomyces sp. 11-1-2]|nr:hypothetical protein CGL27_47930 [Streptomyces sp. 11-1-2]